MCCIYVVQQNIEASHSAYFVGDGNIMTFTKWLSYTSNIEQLPR